MNERWANTTLPKLIKIYVKKNTDLNNLREAAKNMSPPDYSIIQYQNFIVDGVLDYYNVFNKYNTYLSDDVKQRPQDFTNEQIDWEFELSKTYCREKAVWMGYKQIANDNKIITQNWYFNPRQRLINV